jgi:hypothetical protein
MPQSEQKIAGQQNVIPSFDFVYWVLLGVVLTAVAVGFVVYRRKKT